MPKVIMNTDFRHFVVVIYYSNSTVTNQFCLENQHNMVELL